MGRHFLGCCFGSAWSLCLLAIFTSALSMAAVGILLWYFDDKPIIQWNGITLNVIVSLFSTLSKATLAYALSERMGQAKWIWFSRQRRPLCDLNLLDEGSRGPLGSIKVLGHLTARSFISIGAIVIVLSATTDPFIQATVGKKASIRYEDKPEVQIAYAERYSKGFLQTIGPTQIDIGDGNKYKATIVNADFGLKSAVFYGISQPDTLISQQIKPSCPSGNCTWPEFQSLAVCSACNDINDQITKNHTGLTSPLAMYLDMLSMGAFLADVTEYRLPNGLKIDNTVPMTAFGTSNSSASVSFASYNTLIWSMTIMNFTSFRSAIKDGDFTEEIENSPSERNHASWQPSLGDDIVVPPPDSLFYDTTSSVSRSDLQIGGRFNISQNAIYAISDLMNTTFASSRGREGINAFVLGNSTFEPTVMQDIYSSQDLRVTFSTLAKSMTNNIRLNADGHTVQRGQAGIYTILIKIRPWFLSLPVAVIAGGAVFLALVMYHTHASGMAVWGTNALPIVAMGGEVGPILQEDHMPVSALAKFAERKMLRFPSAGPERRRRLDHGEAIITGPQDLEMSPPRRPKLGISDSTRLVSDDGNNT